MTTNCDFWGHSFEFSIVGDRVFIETCGYTQARAARALGNDPADWLVPEHIEDQQALLAACETYCLASGIEPLDDEDDCDAVAPGP